MTTTDEAIQGRPAGVAGSAREFYDRSFPLEGIKILSRAEGHGDGRTVEAYAAVFDTPQEIRDEHGHYDEKIHRASFNRTLNGGARRAIVLYHHGMNVADGRPSTLGGVPLGHPLDIKADSKGLLTVTRYNRSPLADSVLAAIENDDITGYSFRGPIYRSDPAGRVPRVKPGQPLPTVTRMELGLRDYGPTPTPYYAGASIVAVRSATAIFSDIAGLDEIERAELIRLLATTRDSGSEPGTATPHRGLGTEDSREAHSGRVGLLRLRAEALLHGV